MTAVKPMNLVKYAGEFWVTLADYTTTRATEGYSGHASVKAAVRTFVVKTDAGKYIAFRGEQQIKAIIAENRGNPMFRPEDFEGHTRTALIHWSMVPLLNDHFKLDPEVADEFNKFMVRAEDIVEAKQKVAATVEEPAEPDLLEGRSSMTMRLRNEISKVQQRMEADKRNLEKLQHALSALESLELEMI